MKVNFLPVPQAAPRTAELTMYIVKSYVGLISSLFKENERHNVS